jgi:hypothetical protein
MILVLSLGSIGAAGSLIGCSDDGATASTGGGGSDPTTSSTGSGNTDPCAPSASCPGAKSECLALTDYTAKPQFTLRMADLTLTAPPALSSGPVASIVKGGVTMNLNECNLTGNGTFSWLLQFDTATGKLKAGGAKPTKTPVDGYAFVNEMVSGFPIAPFETDVKVGADGKFAMATGANLTVPIYLDITAATVVLLPLHEAKLSGTISADNNCIGKYNSKGLKPADNCTPSPDVPAFVGDDGKADSDGTLDGFITLDEADQVVVEATKQSLCVILSGNSTMYGDGGTPTNKCKRDPAGKILFEGDWCAASNDTACKDSVKLKANFAASAVKLN